MKKIFFTFITAVFAFFCIGANLFGQEKNLPVTEIYNLSRFDGLKQDISELMGIFVPKSFFTRDIMADEETKMRMFYTFFQVNTDEEADYILLYRSLLPESNNGHIIISLKRPDGMTRNYLILIQNKNEGFEIPCCKDLYAFDLSDELALLKQEMTDTGETGDEFLVSLLSPLMFSAEVYKNNVFLQTAEVAVPYEEQFRTYRYNIPYAAVSESGLWTGVGLRNSAYAAPANVSVVIYDKDGGFISHSGSQLPSIPSKGHLSFMVEEMLGTDRRDFEGWMQVSSDQPLSGQIFFFGEESYMVSMPLNPDMSEEPSKKISYLIPHAVQNDEWDTVITVCNPNNRDITVPVQLFDDTGSMVHSESYMITALCSKKYSVSDMVKVFTGSIEIFSPDEIAVFALYSNLKSGGKCYAGAAAVR